MNTGKKKSVLSMTELAILTAIVIVLQCFGHLVKLPFMGTAGNLVLIPIALGACLLGPAAGAWLGLVCGVIIYIFGATGQDIFTYILFTAHPLITALICLVKTTLAGFLAGVIFRWLRDKNETLALFAVGATVPVVNTGVFILGCFTILDTIRSAGEQLGALATGGNVLAFIFVGLAGINFLFELGLSLLLTPAVQRILTIVKKQIHKA